VYWWFRRFIRRFMFQTIHDEALMLNRERVGEALQIYLVGRDARESFAAEVIGGDEVGEMLPELIVTLGSDWLLANAHWLVKHLANLYKQ
jgi:hypothetical protein